MLDSCVPPINLVHLLHLFGIFIIALLVDAQDAAQANLVRSYSRNRCKAYAKFGVMLRTY